MIPSGSVMSPSFSTRQNGQAFAIAAALNGFWKVPM
jgi:hypothetical protein